MKFTRMKTTSSVAGVDPGFSGAIAIVSLPEREVIWMGDMPVLKVGDKRFVNANKFREIFSEHDVRKCFIEEGTAMPKQGVTSMFRYGKACGIVEGVCAGMGVSFELIKPHSWKKAMLYDQKKGKGSSIVKVSQMFPKLSLTRKKDHGIADSILICLFGLKRDVEEETRWYT